MEVYRGEVGTSKNKIVELKAARESGVSKAAEQSEKEPESWGQILLALTCQDWSKISKSTPYGGSYYDERSISSCPYLIKVNGPIHVLSQR
jgi:hypothetical protein